MIWLSYGIFVNDIAIIIPNGLGVFFNLVNIFTLVLLKDRKYSKFEEKENEEDNNEYKEIKI